MFLQFIEAPCSSAQTQAALLQEMSQSSSAARGKKYHAVPGPPLQAGADRVRSSCRNGDVSPARAKAEKKRRGLSGRCCTPCHAPWIESSVCGSSFFQASAFAASQARNRGPTSRANIGARVGSSDARDSKSPSCSGASIRSIQAIVAGICMRTIASNPRYQRQFPDRNPHPATRSVHCVAYARRSRLHPLYPSGTPAPAAHP